MTITPQTFQKKILAWFEKSGRKDLPWQKNITPYRVWISEIMLQQTQVQTVIPYFERFMQNYPTLKKLANANLDDVLHLWSGLGYYARARNLHKTAQIIQTKYKGKFPTTLEALEKLPGIGQSTAGAILSISMQKRGVILDGNVKRVLARCFAISGNDNETLKTLWTLAETYTPQKTLPEYTQAMMDLGATLCTRTKPGCNACPFKKECLAHKAGEAERYPEKRATKKIPTKKTYMLILKNQHGDLLLEKQPPTGIWGSLWSFPQTQSKTTLKKICLEKYGCNLLSTNALPSFRHTFSHFHLEIHPILIEINIAPNLIMEDNNKIWYNATKHKVGLPKPIKQLLGELT